MVELVLTNIRLQVAQPFGYNIAPSMCASAVYTIIFIVFEAHQVTHVLLNVVIFML